MTKTLEERIQALEDIGAIKDLKARYLRACDSQRPDDVRDTLVPEGAIVAYEGFPEFSDRNGFVEVFKQMGCQPGIFDMHHAANPDITLTGADEATGKWALYFNNINLAQRSIMQMGVEYDDRYVRRDGRWWISETRTKRMSFLMQVVDEDGIPKVTVMGDPPEAFGDN